MKMLGIIEATVSLGGLAGLLTGMSLLATAPLIGVTIMLGSVALLVSSLAKLSPVQEARQAIKMDTARTASTSRDRAVMPQS